MDTKVNYSVVGLFVVLLGAAAIMLFLWLSIFKNHQTYNTYFVYMHEQVSGIGPQTPVRFNGVKVGYVQKIELNPLDPQQVVLTLKIKEETPVTTSTIATLQSEGIIGMDYVALKALTATAPPLMVKPGEKYPVIPSEPSLLMKLGTALGEITKTIKELSDNIGKVFDTKNRQAINTSLSNLQKITTALATDSQNINSTTTFMKRFMSNSAKASKQLPEIMCQLNSILTSIKLAAHQFDITGQSVELTVQDAHNTMQNVAVQTMSSVQQLLDKLNVMTGHLQQLGKDLEHNPSILVRGKYPSPVGPGEK